MNDIAVAMILSAALLAGAPGVGQSLEKSGTAPLQSAHHLPAASWQDLSRPENRAMLVDLMSVHMVPGRFETATLAAAGGRTDADLSAAVAALIANPPAMRVAGAPDWRFAAGVDVRLASLHPLEYAARVVRDIADGRPVAATPPAVDVTAR